MADNKKKKAKVNAKAKAKAKPKAKTNVKTKAKKPVNEKKPSKKQLLNIDDQFPDIDEVETKEIKFNAKNSKDLEKQLSEDDDLVTNIDGDEDIDGPKDADLEALEEEEEEQGYKFNQVDIFEGVSLDDPVRMYLKEIGQYNLLSTKNEQDLTKQKQEAQVLLRRKKLPIVLPVDEATKIRLKPEELKIIKKGEISQQRLIECNLRLVVSIAKKYIGHGLSLLDLIQEGNLGLIRGIEKFDYKMGFKLSTYVTWWIRQAVSRALADQSKTIRIPVHMVETINRLNKIKKNLINKLGFEPSIKQIAKEMHISEEKVEEIMQIAQDPVSLDKPVGDEDDSIVADFIADQNVISPETNAERVMLKEQIRELLEGLKDREKKVLMLRFGIDDDHPRTLEEVGKELNVTRERIRQIEDKALRKLKYRAGNLQQLVK